MSETETTLAATRRLLEARTAAGHWVGELSSSALSTATASCALELFRRARPGDGAVVQRLVAAGLAWIARWQNADGGWGDTAESPSNVSTTVLCWVALGLSPELERRHPDSVARAESWIRERAGGLDSPRLSRCLLEAYGDDRTFSVPILTMCALGGRFGRGRGAWETVPQIPFELGAVPHRWLSRIGLPMVSYALPALIAIGQVRHHSRPTRNPLTRLLRTATRRRTLEVLCEIQPAGGGFLEAAPLTSFVTMSLIGCGRADHPVVDRAVDFLVRTVRDDGSWPIDTNLATWLTTLSVNALAAGGGLAQRMSEEDRGRVLSWLLAQQYRREHPYTAAAPGGWAWTDLSGGVPDADDTAGALVAIHNLATARSGSAEIERRIGERAWSGIEWLIDLQNRDGGIPTFCRGWGKLPFDRSCPDLTAHALRAWSVWRPAMRKRRQQRIDRARDAALRYLLVTQGSGGTWTPLWFGNQYEPGLENPLYGTTRVLLASAIDISGDALGERWSRAVSRAVDWVVAVQSSDGGWGGGPSARPTVEETALALEALAPFVGEAAVSAAVERGVSWLERATKDGKEFPASPIGLYFARLWYSERLYPLIFSVSALERLRASAVASRAGAAGA